MSANEVEVEAPPLAAALRDLVSTGAGAGGGSSSSSSPAASAGAAAVAGPRLRDAARALQALDDHPQGEERFWAATSLLFGLPAGGGLRVAVGRDVARAEAWLLEALESEEGIAQCPDCAALWAFGHLQGVFGALRLGSPVPNLAKAHGVTEPFAAYALAARHGSPLGRLAWGGLRAGGALAAQHAPGAPHWGAAAPQDAEEHPAAGRPAGRRPVGGGVAGAGAAAERDGCVDALQAAMAVATAAMAHEQTPVPQPMDLYQWARARHEDKQSYALASQLAADGYAEGLAAKAEMLFYGRERVVPGGGARQAEAHALGVAGLGLEPLADGEAVVLNLAEVRADVAFEGLEGFEGFKAVGGGTAEAGYEGLPLAGDEGVNSDANFGAAAAAGVLLLGLLLATHVAAAGACRRRGARAGAPGGARGTARGGGAAAAAQADQPAPSTSEGPAAGRPGQRGPRGGPAFGPGHGAEAADGAAAAGGAAAPTGGPAASYLADQCSGRRRGRGLPGGRRRRCGGWRRTAQAAVVLLALSAAAYLTASLLAWCVETSGLRLGGLANLSVLSPAGSLPPDHVGARELFREAALAGHWGAAYALAMLDLDGEDRSEAEPWLEQVVMEGHGAAKAFAGHFQYRWGLGRPKDARRAGILLQEAAALGEANAALLLAEAHAHEAPEGEAEVEPPGGRNISAALDFYRNAASAGRSTCRYNVGVLLLRLAGGASTEDLSPEACLEARAEFVEVATDLEPTIRLLFALATRSWDLGDAEGSLGTFTLLSEAGSSKAHRNAAALWEAALPRLPDEAPTEAEAASAEAEAGAAPAEARPENHCAPTADAPVDTARSLGRPPPAAIRGDEKQADDDEPLCDARDVEEEVGPSLELVHEGRFCCPSGECGEDGCTCRWFLNEGDFDPMECLQHCLAESECTFATVYATGYCQLAADCERSYPAGDDSAQTYQLRGPGQRQRSARAARCRAQTPEAAATAEPAPQAAAERAASLPALAGGGAATPGRGPEPPEAPPKAPPAAPDAPPETAPEMAQARQPPESEATPAALEAPAPPLAPLRCWPAAAGNRPAARRCAAAYHARAAGVGGDPTAPEGSALASGGAAAEAAALGAARHLEALQRPGPAHAWGCWAARRFGSAHGRLLCASLEAEAWEGHPRNLTKAFESLREISMGAATEVWIAAHGAAAWWVLYFAWTVASSCHLGLQGASCPALDAASAAWGAPGQLFDRAAVERALTAAAAVAAALVLSAGVRALAALAALSASSGTGRRRGGPVRSSR